MAIPKQISLLIAVLTVCGVATAQQPASDPVELAQPTSPGGTPYRPLPRTEIPGTMRDTQVDLQPSPIGGEEIDEEVVSPRDTIASHVVPIVPVPPGNGRTAEPLSSQPSRAADTLDYLPQVREEIATDSIRTKTREQNETNNRRSKR